MGRIVERVLFAAHHDQAVMVGQRWQDPVKIGAIDRDIGLRVIKRPPHKPERRFLHVLDDCDTHPAGVFPC